MTTKLAGCFLARQPAPAGREREDYGDREMKELAAVIFAAGDPSVGIPHVTWTIDNIGDLDDYDTQRQEFREALEAAFSCLAERPSVSFSDERRTEDD